MRICGRFSMERYGKHVYIYIYITLLSQHTTILIQLFVHVAGGGVLACLMKYSVDLDVIIC